MSVSPHLVHCPDVKLYQLNVYDFPEETYSILEPGLSVVITTSTEDILDYFGGSMEYAIPSEAKWVEITEIRDEWIIGKLDQDGKVFREGSTIIFRKENIERISGTVQWNIDHLSVLVSERVVYHREPVGYYYSFIIEDPLLLGRRYYAQSETHLPKENIKMLRVPLASLVSYDPLVADYLETPAMDGFIRVDEFTFQEYLVEPRDTNVYPRGYLMDWDEEEDNFLADDGNLPF